MRAGQPVNRGGCGCTGEGTELNFITSSEESTEARASRAGLGIKSKFTDRKARPGGGQKSGQKEESGLYPGTPGAAGSRSGWKGRSGLGGQDQWAPGARSDPLRALPTLGRKRKLLFMGFLRPLGAPQAWIPPPTHRGPQRWVLFEHSPLPPSAGSPPPSGSLPLPAGPSGVELPKQACVQAAWALSGQSGGLGPLPHSGSRTGIE